MSIRKRDDSIKGGRGIDGTQGEKFTKQGITSHLGQDGTYSDRKERGYSPNAKRSSGDNYVEVGVTDAGLRQVDDFGYRAETRDIYSDVDGNSEGTNGGFSGPVKYGVNRPQGKKR
jgi:hypothetical protein